jgi:hypothetical protein
MGLLSEEAAGQIGELLEVAPIGDPTEEVVEVAAAPEPEPEPVAESSEPEVDVKEDSGVEESKSTAPEPAADDGKAADEGAPGHRVPYNRFKSVVDARNEYRAKATELESQLDVMRAQHQPTPPPAPVPQRVPEPEFEWETDLRADDSPVGDPRYEQLAEQIQVQKVSIARMQLEHELKEAKADYPNVPDEVLINAVVQNPQASVRELAEQYSTFVASIEEGAIASYLESNPGATLAVSPQVEETGVEEAVAPRPRSSGQASRPVSTGKEDSGPKTLRDAREALSEFLQHNNPFSS